jgi:ABC-type metal ion transport system substrate-binding protein
MRQRIAAAFCQTSRNGEDVPLALVNKNYHDDRRKQPEESSYEIEKNNTNSNNSI